MRELSFDHEECVNTLGNNPQMQETDPESLDLHIVASSYLRVLAGSGCHRQTPGTGGRKQQKLIS